MCTVVNFQNLKVVQMEVENANPSNEGSINPLISFSSLSTFLVFLKICMVLLKHPTQVVHERRNQQERNHFIVMDDQKVFVYTMSG